VIRPIARNRTRLRFETLEPRLALDARLVITELVASNNVGLRDEDGDRPDWLEIFNAGDMAANLDGWHLTDDRDDLSKWELPPVALPPQNYLVVFASGKDRADPAAPLHTNFRLRAGGEYLALVEPDGATVAYQMDFPPQHADVSYGFPQAATVINAITAQSAAKILVPTTGNGGDQLGDSWTQVDFDDTSWQDGSARLGFDLLGTFDAPPQTNLQEEMFRVNASVFVRVPFMLEHAGEVSSLQLHMQFNDGYVAYLNGSEVARSNAPEFLGFASSSVDQLANTNNLTIDLAAFKDLLREGDNVLAIHGLNSGRAQGNFLVSPELTIGWPGALSLDQGRYFVLPTPGGPNGDVSYGSGLVKALAPSVPHGFYDQPFDLAISSATPGATIVYTVDGSLPTLENGSQFIATGGDAPSTLTLNIARTTTLRAKAYHGDDLPSDVLTQTYLFLDDILAVSPDRQPPAGWPAGPVNQQVLDYGMDPDILDDTRFGPLVRQALLDLPSISLVTDQANLTDPGTGIFVNAKLSRNNSRSWERPVSVELVNPDGAEGFQIDAGLRIRGGASRKFNNPKHAFRLFFRGEYGAPKLTYPLFGAEGVTTFDNVDLRTAQAPSWTWCVPGDSLVGCRFNTFVRDVFNRDTQRDMGHPYTRSRYYHLYLNGQYWGLFQTEERPEASFAESYLGGNKEDYDVIKHDRSIGANEATDGNFDAWRQLWTIAKEGFADNEAYYRVQGLNTDGSRNPEYPVLLDMDNLIDYMQIILYGGNLDAPITNFASNKFANNWYGIRNRNGEEGFRFLIHDAEWTLMNVKQNRLGPWPAGETFDQSNPQWIHQQLMENAEYRLRFADRAQKHFFHGGPLTPDAALARIRERIDQIDLAIIAESARWGDAQRTDQPYTKDDWLKEISHIVDDYLPQRTEIVINQFKNAVGPDGQTPAPLYPDVAAPEYRRHGGHVPFEYRLSIRGPGEIYYTLDGTDPRRAASTAVRYTEPIMLAASTVVKARARVGDTWSAINEATFFVDTPLRITEIDAQPFAVTEAERSVGRGWSSGDFAFVELQNTAAVPIDVGGMALTGPVAFTFPAGEMSQLQPGQFILVVRNRTAFASRYGSDLPVLGEFAEGQFDVGRGPLVLRDRLGAAMETVTDGTNRPWPRRTAGQGSSLERSRVNQPATDPASWAASAEYGGSPGRGAADVAGQVLINELLVGGSSDRIELVNTSREAVDLSGWTLANGSRQLDGFVFPHGTTIDAGAYLVIDAADTGLAFSRLIGGELLLVERAEDGTPLVFVDHVRFDGNEAGVALGRFPNADRNGLLFPLTAETFGRANAPPLPSQVLLTEIHYRPVGKIEHDFDRGTAEGLTPRSGIWQVVDGRYQVTPDAAGDTVSTIDLLGPTTSSMTVSTTVRISSDTTFNKNAALIFDYRNPTDFKFASVHAGSGRWRIGRRDANGWNFLATAKKPVALDRDVPFTVAIDGSVVTVRSGASIMVRYDFEEPLSGGMLGVGSKNGQAMFDDITVWPDPDPDALEFVELFNPSGQPIDLNGWRLTGGIEWTFDKPRTIAAGEAIALVGFDPADTRRATLFRQRSGIRSDIRLAGPFAGHLSDGGELLSLTRPIASGAGRTSVDQLVYRAEAPWPAVGRGQSLHRLVAQHPGNDPVNWTSASPNPGTVSLVAQGDMDRNGQLSMNDVAAFTLGLVDPAAYQATFGLSASLLGDLDADGDFDFDDIDDFVALLNRPLPAGDAATAAAVNSLSGNPFPAGGASVAGDGVATDRQSWPARIPFDWTVLADRAHRQWGVPTAIHARARAVTSAHPPRHAHVHRPARTGRHALNDTELAVLWTEIPS